jgi:hypothetical protein
MRKFLEADNDQYNITSQSGTWLKSGRGLCRAGCLLFIAAGDPNDHHRTDDDGDATSSSILDDYHDAASSAALTSAGQMAVAISGGGRWCRHN